MNLKQILQEEIEKIQLPTKKWLLGQLRGRAIRFNKKVLDLFIVGSVAKGTNKKSSDLDIAVIIPPIKGKTSLQFTENYHNICDFNKCSPIIWNNMNVDFQFFYPSDSEIENYSKLELN